MPDLSFSLDLGNYQTNRTATRTGLVHTEPTGLEIESGLAVRAGYSYSLFGNDAYTNGIVNGIEGYAPQTMTTVQFTDLHLAAGTKLTFDYDYIPADRRWNDFAFSLLADSQGIITPNLLGDERSWVSNGFQTHYTASYTIGATDTYKLLLASADAGDTLGHSALIIHDIAITLPQGSYTLLPTGVQDPSGNLLAAGTLSAGAAAEIVALETAVGAGLIGQDGNGLIGQDGNGLIGQDGNGLRLPDGTSLIGQDGNGLIGQDGNGLIGQDGNGLIGQDGNGVISNDGGTAVSHDGASLINADQFANLISNNASLIDRNLVTGVVSNDGGTLIGRQFSSASVADVVPPPIVSAIVPDLPLKSPFGVGPAVAALAGGGFVMASVGIATGNAQILTLRLIADDGSVTNTPFGITSVPNGTQISAISVAASASGGFAVAWQELVNVAGADTVNSYVDFYDGAGNGYGTRAIIANDQTAFASQPAVTALAGGGYAVVAVVPDGAAGSTLRATQYTDAGAPVGSPTFVNTPLVNGTASVPVITRTFGGGFAVAFQEHGRDSFGYAFDQVYLDILTPSGGNVTVRVSDPAAAGSRSPAIATLANGNIAVAWVDDSQTNSFNPVATLHSAVFSPDGSLLVGSSASVGTIDGNTFPTITALANGGFILTWQHGTVYQVTPTIYDIKNDAFQSRLVNANGTPAGDVFAGSTVDPSQIQAKLPASALSTSGTLLIAGDAVVGTSVYAGHETLTFGDSAASGAGALDGRAADPYLAGATVFADSNGNGVKDAGEASTTTDAQGRFEFGTAPAGTLVLTGGTDTGTGKANTQTFTAPTGSTAITALTTLIQKLAAGNGGDLGAALYRVTQAFGLPPALELTKMDPVAATQNNLPNGQAAFVAAAIVESSVLAARNNGAAGDLYGTLAADIAAAPAGRFDPTSTAVMQSFGLGAAAAAKASASASAAQAQLSAKLATDANNGNALIADVSAILGPIQAPGGSGGGTPGGGSTGGFATIGVYRFFDSRYGTHFFTSDAGERDQIIANRKDLISEGVGLTAVDPASNDPNAAPVYRFFDTKFGTHFFTASAAERDQVIAARSDLTFEGTGFLEHATQQAGDIPVYRFFDTVYGTHFYTADATERANILANRPDLTPEGIGFYAPTAR